MKKNLAICAISEFFKLAEGLIIGLRWLTNGASITGFRFLDIESGLEMNGIMNSA